ncbi:hypothetical protein [Syntrophus aciditrophicus]|nr:hypothetical protein [Syntrophus aciditrophicus]
MHETVPDAEKAGDEVYKACPFPVAESKIADFKESLPLVQAVLLKKRKSEYGMSSPLCMKFF